MRIVRWESYALTFGRIKGKQKKVSHDFFQTKVLAQILSWQQFDKRSRYSFQRKWKSADGRAMRTIE
ncbi:MAG: hypothetical protein AAFR87_07085 [Bacteroidota bacterium]